MTEGKTPRGSQLGTTGGAAAVMQESVHERFGRRLPGRIAAVQRLVESARAEPAPSEIQLARQESHKLAGAAGMYGHDEVSRAARMLEELLQSQVVVWSEVDAALTLLVATTHQRVKPSEVVRAADVPRVLLIDDDVGTRDHAAELAGRQLAEIVWVPTLARAMALTAQGAWDAVIVDASTGTAGDAFVGARLLRGQVQGRRVPVAVTSVDTSLAARVAATHAGGDLFLPKPVSLETLSEAVVALAAQGRAGRLCVVVLDDDLDFLAIIADILAADGIVAVTLTDPDLLMAALDEHDPDAVLLDCLMPAYSGIELCSALRANRCHKELPILFVTGDTSTAQRMAAYESGCDDYFVKPIVAAELCTRVRARIGRSAALRAAAERDGLTGLPLRRVFIGGLEARLSEAARHNSRLSVCLLDLDEFKQINDLHGHRAGDQVLARLGTMIATRFRGEDLRCRWGGEEFAMAFPGEDRATMAAVVVRLLDELAGEIFVGGDGTTFSATFSAGIAEFPADGIAVDELVSAADRRLYQAKRDGRARVESFVRPARDSVTPAPP